METRIYLVRHAESDHAVTDESARPLTPRGMEDRLLACRYLRDKGIEAVWSSPYLRAVQTVEPLARELGLTIEKDPAFRERDLGDTSGIEGLRKRQWADPDFAAPGGESLRQVRERFSSAVDSILMKHQSAVAIGSHGMAICAVQSHYDPSFGYEDYLAVSETMPRVVCMLFRDKKFVEMEEIKLR